MNEQNEIVKKVIHSHEPVPEKCMFKRTIKKKEQVVTTLSTSLDITKMPSIEYLRDTFKRTRNSRLGFITGCIMDIPEVLQVYSKKNRFLRFDSGMQDNDRFIIFFSEFKKSMIEKIDTGLVNALRISFPGANCNGCLFHLGQAAYKRVGAMGDIEKFKNDSNYNLVFKKILRLAFVPIRDVPVFYKDIKKFIQDNSITTTANFQLYFENNYLVSHVTREDNGGRAVANINFWNVFDRVKNEIPGLCTMQKAGIEP
ncbi:MULE domain-containing protein [Vairimorpha necatrix]|uniref:MULE domain-containing protein n=1 Tax=Vairimorpha necatrix TaxID=6039 RepID=A0AAX4JFY4_9MICR